MTKDNLPAPWSNGESFDLEAAIRSAVELESRRSSRSEIIEMANAKCQEVLREAFDRLVRLHLPESLLKALDYEIVTGASMYGCTCRLTYRGWHIYLNLPANSMSDWRVSTGVLENEYCSANRLYHTVLMFLHRLVEAPPKIPFSDCGDCDEEYIEDELERHISRSQTRKKPGL